MQKVNLLKQIRELSNYVKSILQKEHIAKDFATASAAIQQNETCETPRPFEEIPGDRIIPFIGTAWTWMPIIGLYKPDRFHWANQVRRKRYGSIFREKFGPLNTVVCFSVDDLKAVLKAEGPYPSRGEFSSLKAYRESRKHLYSSTGLLVLEGKEWGNLRNKIQKHMLKPKALHAYCEPLRHVAKDFVRRIFDVKYLNNEVPDLLQDLHKWALESVSLVGLDTRLGCLETNLSQNSEAMKVIESINTIVVCVHKLEPLGGNAPFWKLFPTPTWKKFERASDTYSEIAFKYINKSLEDLKLNDGSKQLTLLQSMLATKDLDVAEAMVFVSDLIMAGIESTAHSTGFLMYHLAKNPDKQDLLYQEVMKLLPTKEDELNPDIYESLTYTKACLKETMRFTPVISGNVRLIAEDTVLSGFKVPAGNMVLVPHDGLFMDEKYFKNPTQFLPERWLGKDERPVLAFIPFGFGPRSCIGKRLAELEIVSFMIEIIRNFRLEYHFEDIGYYTRTLNIPDKPLRINFIPR